MDIGERPTMASQPVSKKDADQKDDSGGMPGKLIHRKSRSVVSSVATSPRIIMAVADENNGSRKIPLVKKTNRVVPVLQATPSTSLAPLPVSAPRQEARSIEDVAQKRKRYSKACNPCQYSKIACDGQRPCARCLKRGHPQDCTEPVRKKRGRKRRHGIDGVANAVVALPMQCDECQSTNAVKYCLQCVVGLCQECFQKIHAFKILQHHQSRQVAQADNTGIMRNMDCDVHSTPDTASANGHGGAGAGTGPIAVVGAGIGAGTGPGGVVVVGGAGAGAGVDSGAGAGTLVGLGQSQTMGAASGFKRVRPRQVLGTCKTCRGVLYEGGKGRWPKNACTCRGFRSSAGKKPAVRPSIVAEASAATTNNVQDTRRSSDYEKKQ